MPLPDQVSQIGQSDGGHDGALHCQASEGIHLRPDLLLDQAVQGEGEGQRQGDPRQRTLEDHQEHHGGARQHDRDPVRGAQPLAQHQRGEGHGDQRIDEVAQSGVGCTVGVDTIDVDEPVDRDQEPADGQRPQQTGRAADAGKTRPTAARGDERQTSAQGPHDPMTDDLHTAGRGQQVEVEGEDAPQGVAADDQGHSGAVERS